MNKSGLNAVLNSVVLNAEESNDIGYYINKDKNNQTIDEENYRLLEDGTGILNPSGDYINNTYTGTVLLDSELKKNLNETYYTTSLGVNSNIIDGTYNVGPYNNESAYKWTGKVASLTIPEYNAAGGDASHLKKSYYWWLLSPSGESVSYVSCISQSGKLSNDFASYNNGVRPVLYLSSNITLTGTGENPENAFTIS